VGAGMVWRFVLFTMCLIGHTGFWLACFNRINATGISRSTIKRTEKCIVLSWAIIPLLIAVFHWKAFGSWLAAEQGIWDLPGWVALYGIACILFVLVVGPFWLATRFPLKFQPDRLMDTQLHRWNTVEEIGDSIFRGRVCRLSSRLPFNQIGHLELSIKRLDFPQISKLGRPLKIGHISDLHLTGYMANDYYTFALEQVMQHKPDMIVLSGDIIDYDHMLPHVEPILSRLRAPFGCYFLLGNHDRRILDPAGFRDLLVNLGWHDVGMKSTSIRIENGQLYLVGNEKPWFPNAHEAWSESDDPAFRPEWELRIAVAHSPDQFGWAVDLNADLMLCGHTHGGQARFPIIGPIVAPSWHGSKFASGLFLRENTLMHVSRGLSGVHPLRFRCMPEVSVLELHG
jgi:uncharacterized protein